MLIHASTYKQQTYVPDLVVEPYDSTVRSLFPTFSLSPIASGTAKHLQDELAGRTAQYKGNYTYVEKDVSSFSSLKYVYTTGSVTNDALYWNLPKADFPEVFTKGDFSIAMCVYVGITDNTPEVHLFSCCEGNGFYLAQISGKLRFAVHNGSNYTSAQTSVALTKGFHTIQAVKTSTTVTLWVNGVKEASVALPAYAPPQANLVGAMIGSNPDVFGPDGRATDMRGYAIYHAAWFDRALTDAEVASVWKSAILNYANRSNVPDVVTFDLSKPITGMSVQGMSSGAPMTLTADKTPIYRRGRSGDMGHVLKYGNSVTSNTSDWRCFYTDGTFASRFNMYQRDVCFTADVSAETLYALDGYVIGMWKQIGGQGDVLLGLRSAAPSSLMCSVAVYNEQAPAFSTQIPQLVAGQRLRVDFIKAGHYYVAARDGIPFAAFSAKTTRTAHTSGNNLVLGTYMGSQGQLYPDLSYGSQGHDLNCYGLTLKRLS